VKLATWADCRADFAFDGALVDLIVPGTGPAEWEAFWAGIRAGPFPLRAFRDGEPAPLFETAAAAFAEQETVSVLVSVLAGPVTANCHFFGGDLELDIDPREVTGEAAFGSVLELMRLVARAVGQPVLATPEGFGQAGAFLSVSPEGEATYLPPARGWFARWLARRRGGT
jgi:hypothetical protein